MATRERLAAKPSLEAAMRGLKGTLEQRVCPHWDEEPDGHGTFEVCHKSEVRYICCCGDQRACEREGA